MKISRKQVSAFLLIEHLVTVGVFVVSLLVLLGIVKSLGRILQNMAVVDSVEWHVCFMQLDDSLNGYQFKEGLVVSYIDDTPQGRERVYLRGYPKDPPKSTLAIEKNRGHVPILVGYKRMLMKRKQSHLQLYAQLLHDEEFQMDYWPAKRKILVSVKEVSKAEKTREPVSAVSCITHDNESSCDRDGVYTSQSNSAISSP